jgi:hypothetical protein
MWLRSVTDVDPLTEPNNRHHGLVPEDSNAAGMHRVPRHIGQGWI